MKKNEFTPKELITKFGSEKHKQTLKETKQASPVHLKQIKKELSSIYNIEYNSSKKTYLLTTKPNEVDLYHFVPPKTVKLIKSDKIYENLFIIFINRILDPEYTGRIHFTRTTNAQYINLINEYYKKIRSLKYSDNIDILSEQLNIDENAIVDYINTTDRLIKKYIDSILESLSPHLILPQIKDIMVAIIDEYGTVSHRRATEEELKLISDSIGIADNICNFNKYDGKLTIGQLRYLNPSHKTIVNSILNKEDISYFYYSYSIAPIRSKVTASIYNRFKTDHLHEIIKETNDLFQEKINTNAKNRKNKYYQDFRSEEGYLLDINLLSDVTIPNKVDSDYKEICNMIDQNYYSDKL